MEGEKLRWWRSRHTGISLNPQIQLYGVRTLEHPKNQFVNDRKILQVEGDSLVGLRCLYANWGTQRSMGTEGGITFCGREKGTEREAVDCSSVLGQEENLSRPRTRLREIGRIPVYSANSFRS